MRPRWPQIVQVVVKMSSKPPNLEILNPFWVDLVLFWVDLVVFYPKDDPKIDPKFHAKSPSPAKMPNSEKPAKTYGNSKFSLSQPC